MAYRYRLRSSTCPFFPETTQLIETRHDPAEVHRWTLHALDGAHGYKAALAVEGADWNLKCWDWPTATVGGTPGYLSRATTPLAFLAGSVHSRQ